MEWKFDGKRGVLACIHRQSSLLETGLGLVMHEEGLGVKVCMIFV